MPTIPLGNKVIFTSTDVDMEQRKSAQLNDITHVFTMEDITDTVNSVPISSLKLNYPESFETLPGLPPINPNNTKITILEEFDPSTGDTGGMFNWIWSLNTKGSTPIDGYAYQMYNNFDINTPESQTSTRIQTQLNNLSYRGAGNVYFLQGDGCTPKIKEASDGNIYPPRYFYSMVNEMTSDAGTGVPPASGSDFWLAQKNKVILKTDNLAINYLYGLYMEWDIDNNVSVNQSMRQLYLNADLLGNYSGTINEYVGIYHDADGFTIGGNTTEGHFIKNTANMPITTAGGLTFSNSLPAHADDAAAGASGLTAGQVYQTDGTGLAPLNVAGILMIKQ